MTDPESVHALTGAYVLDALEPAEQDAFEHHLAVCADCREEVRSLRSAVVRLPSVAAVAPPSELRASVLAAISAVRPLPPLIEQTEPEPTSEPAVPAAPVDDELRRVRQRRRDRSDRWRLVAAAAVVVALVSVGWGIVRPGADDPVRGTATIERSTDDRLAELLEAPDLEVYTSTSTADGARGTVLTSASLELSAMLVQDLPGLDADHAYQAWTIQGATPTDAGVFDVVDGATAVLMEGQLGAVDAVAVTVEPVGGSDSPTGDILVQVPLS